MPAPKLLAGLPKPLLFAVYGAVGGLLGALLAEPAYRLLTPPPPPPSHQVAVALPREVEVYADGRNSVLVQVARDGFDGPVTVRLDGLPEGLSAEPLVVPAGKDEGQLVVIGDGTAAAATRPLTAVAAGGEPAATAEVPVSLTVTRAPRPLADVVFVLDVTSSMQWAIDDLKNGIGTFADSLGQARLDFRLGLVTFQDVSNPGESVHVVRFRGSELTPDPAAFRDQVALLRATGGGDIPESSLEGVAAACALPFRQNATKVLLLITDAPPKVGRTAAPPAAVAVAAKGVAQAGIDSVHIVVQRFDKDVYTPLTAAGGGQAGGRYFDLGDVVRGEEGFGELLATFGSAVTAAAVARNPDAAPRVPARAAAPVLRSLQSGERSAAGSEGRLVLRSAGWTAGVAALVCLFLLGGQTHYLRGSLPAAGGVAVGLLGGLGAGVVGGAAGQGLFFLAPESAALAVVFRVVGWVLLGGLAGVGLAAVIPNMRWPLGLAGGAAGGAAGAVGFIAASAVTGDLAGRLAGGLALGLCIGLLVVAAEAVRSVWLDVRFGPRETIRVTLGPEPVKVGGDAAACTVWARGGPPVAVRFFVRDGRVVCDDVVRKREEVVSAGYSREVGNVTVTVRSGSAARAEAPAARPPAPLALDDDDLPLPLPAPRAPVGSKPVPPAAPRPAPAPKPAAADGCPGCGRAATGKPGLRYCMMCDRTF